jgi:two-component system chemotaxis sensor kinase CheA
MFQNGVTTCEEATDVSGRGVGLAAVVSACRAAGGRVEVETHEGKGTRFRFAFPSHAVQVRETVVRSLRKPSTRPSGPLRAVNT